MKFRPCIDIHNGQVKQIVGGSLTDKDNHALENFVSNKDGSFYASYYRNLALSGGHIILLNPRTSPYHEQNVKQALSALREWPGHLQLGGGVTPDNAGFFLDAGASHVIVTSYVFSDGKFNRDHLQQMIHSVGRERLVLDLSCRKKKDQYYIVTDRWQKFTKDILTPETLETLTDSCAEFLIHAVDTEGTASGIEEPLVKMMTRISGFPVTYAGGVGSYDDLRLIKELGRNLVDVTIGSALDMFGGPLSLEEILAICKQSLQ